MKLLYVHEDGLMQEHEVKEFDEGDLQSVDEGILDIIRFENGHFERLVVSSEEVPDDEDDEESEEHTEYSVDSWSRL